MAIDPIIIIVLLVVGMPVLMFFVLVLMDVFTNKKAKMLYFETERVVKLLNVNVKDGAVKIGKKRFIVDKVKPAYLPSGLIVRSFRPLFVVKWDKVLPFNFVPEGIKMLTSAENLKNLIENKTLEQLLRPKDANKQAILMFIIGAVMGGLVGYVITTI